jgi:ribosomal protein S18 acetylase RimI-like enzyme
MIEIVETDFSKEEHCRAVVKLMNDYMTDAMGNHPPHDKESAERLIVGLKKHCNKLCILAKQKNNFVGLVNCFIGFGTFAAKPFINIHDVAVLESYRGKGIGRKMLEFVIDKAKMMDCVKITLEVRNDNQKAQQLYSSLEFKDGKPPMYFWTKYL